MKNLFVLFLLFTSGATFAASTETSITTTDTQTHTQILTLDLTGKPKGLFKISVNNGIDENSIQKPSTDFTQFKFIQFKINGQSNSLYQIAQGRYKTHRYVQLSQDINTFEIKYQGYPSSVGVFLVQQVELDDERHLVSKFRVNQTAGVAPLNVSFYGGYSYDPNNSTLSYYWDFGDGSQGTGINPKHIYSSPGTYTATLRVVDRTGREDSFSMDISVNPNNTPPITNLIPVIIPSIQSLDANIFKVIVSAAGSFDPDGSIEKYQINFGDGTSTNSISEEHIYSAVGTYVIKIRAIDNLGGIAEKELSLTVKPPMFEGQSSEIISETQLSASPSGSMHQMTLNAVYPNGFYVIRVINADGSDRQTNRDCTGLIDRLMCEYENWSDGNFISTQRVRYGSLSVNGRMLTASGDIDHLDRSFTGIVQLKDAAKLNVFLVGPETSSATIAVTGFALTPPTIRVDNFPAILNGSLVSFTAHITSYAPAQTRIRIPGQLDNIFTSDEINFTGDISQLPDGTHSIDIYSTNSGGQSAQAVLVTVDRTPPVLQASAGTAIVNNSFQLNCSVSEFSKIKVEIEGMLVSEGDYEGLCSKSISVPIQDAEGFNVKVTAIDGAQNSTSKEFYASKAVSFDVVSPDLTKPLVVVTGQPVIFKVKSTRAMSQINYNFVGVNQTSGMMPVSGTYDLDLYLMPANFPVTLPNLPMTLNFSVYTLGGVSTKVYKTTKVNSK